MGKTKIRDVIDTHLPLIKNDSSLGYSFYKKDMYFNKLHTCHLAATFMRRAITLLVNLFGARIWIFISASKKETHALKRALILVL